MKLTPNDQRVLNDVEWACSEWDAGFIPHGASDWIAVRRLESLALIQYSEWARCQSCDDCDDVHEQQAFKLTAAGESLLKASRALKERCK